MSWAIKVTDEYADWFRRLFKEDLGSAIQVSQAVAALRAAGPTLGRPLADRLKGSELHHLKELRPGAGGRSEISAGTATTFRWPNSSTANTPATRTKE